MRTRSALLVAVAVGFSLWGCSDEAAGPGVGPDTSWQIYCAEDDPDMNCSASEAAHGPLDGKSETDKLDDYKLKATCKKLGSGLSITLEDPGREANVAKKLAPRARSILEISRAKPDDNECFVTVTEYPLSGAQQLKVQDACLETELKEGIQGTCTLEGGAANGYAFEGTVICEGMKYKGNGNGAWTLRRAARQNEPVKLQIDNCD